MTVHIASIQYQVPKYRKLHGGSVEEEKKKKKKKKKVPTEKEIQS